jgi:hypothetical protein
MDVTHNPPQQPAPQRIKPFPTQEAVTTLATMATAFDSMADILRDLDPSNLQWVADNLAGIEKAVNEAETVLGAARRCKHIARQRHREACK